MANVVNRTERGWSGHFICADRCQFRRNTLIECGDTRIVVSTVGLMAVDEQIQTIGPDWYSETLAFYAKYDGRYWGADVARQVSFDSPGKITILDAGLANDMHETVVAELIAKMEVSTSVDVGMV